jgi:hypothetical protein
VTSITPPHIHISFELLFRAGIFLIITWGDPGAHGAGVTGTHGIGVNTPMAAAVADITDGLDGDWHIPKGMMLAIGLLSMMLAAGLDVALTRFTGRTISELGATPKLHFSIAPIQTRLPIIPPL